MFGSLHKEVKRHKWFESEKRGFDVGWDFAETARQPEHCAIDILMLGQMDRMI